MYQLQVEFVLPLIGATDLDDWPGGVRQMFKAAAPMVEEILRNILVCWVGFSGSNNYWCG